MLHVLPSRAGAVPLAFLVDDTTHMTTKSIDLCKLDFFFLSIN